MSTPYRRTTQRNVKQIPKVDDFSYVASEASGTEAGVASAQEFGAAFIPRKKQSSVKHFIRGVILIVVITVVVGVFAYSMSRGGVAMSPQKNDKKFHAVFLSNGQVFFGNIVKENNTNIVLDNVFYVQTVNEQVTNSDGTTSAVPRPQLVKKGEEFYGPGTSIRINRSQVTVVEDLREDTQIMQDIRSQL